MVFGNESDEDFIGGSYGQVQPYSDVTAAEIDEEIKSIIDSCYDDAKAILHDKAAIVEGLAQRLLEVNKVDGPEFEEIYTSNGDLTAIHAREAEMKEKYSNPSSDEENKGDDAPPAPTPDPLPAT